MKVAICTPTITHPLAAYVGALQASEAPLKDAGHETSFIIERGNPYISAARATMLRKALDGGAETIVFVDHDLSWRPQDLLALIEAPGEVIAGDYRFKRDDEEYMGTLVRDGAGRPVGQHAGDTETLVLRAERVPAGFLKITRAGVERFMRTYPHLCYGSPINPSVDLFNHGAHEGVWWGEDYAFSRNWIAAGGDLWVIPDLDLTHHSATDAYPGNLHRWLMAQPGGANDPASNPSGLAQPQGLHG